MKADGKDQYIKYGNNADVVRNVVACYERWKEQPMELVEDLRNVPIEDACYAIFCYVTDAVRYQIDPVGYQYIKSPARLLADGCGDCKSFTLFIVSCLHCLGIPCIIRFVNFDGGEQYSHVYAVALDGSREIIIDPVERINENTIQGGEPCFNYARGFKRKLDIRV